MGQLLLMPDPRPLEERLGGDFFKSVPEHAGVYLMRDAADRVLYVGKARNLRQRLQSYRIANPDRMPRRHLRMLRQVARIEFQFCPGEAAALQRESQLLRSLKPRFNRAGVWPGKTNFLVWRRAGDQLEVAVTETPETGWQRHGPLGSGARYLHRSVARLLWLGLHPDRVYGELPVGWAQGSMTENVAISCGHQAEELTEVLDTFFWDGPEGLALWLRSRVAARRHPFECAMLEEDLERLDQLSAQSQPREKK